MVYRSSVLRSASRSVSVHARTRRLRYMRYVGAICGACGLIPRSTHFQPFVALRNPFGFRFDGSERQGGDIPIARSAQGPQADQLFPDGQNLDELFDVCSPPLRANEVVRPDSGALSVTGHVKERGLVHKSGDWHRSVHVWLLDSTGDLLLQKRSEHKDTHPNRWDVSCAGHIGAGDDGLSTAVRELDEELGIKVDASALQHLFTFAGSISGETAKHGPFYCNEYQEVYLVRAPGAHASAFFAPGLGEVSALRAEALDETERKLRSGDATYVPRHPNYVDALFGAIRKQ
eukprot:TRINITY_DN57586_c0_g1_i1.p1 TRINITY_DN57586_c0_g1~~TRINITY_DN57586_c0_g1_i1.p1  ORF type:complete len:289 (-),score=22.16 TRINITY_DN57586_c0_g1_i1:50-916(-)